MLAYYEIPVHFTHPSLELSKASERVIILAAKLLKLVERAVLDPKKEANLIGIFSKNRYIYTVGNMATFFLETTQKSQSGVVLNRYIFKINAR